MGFIFLINQLPGAFVTLPGLPEETLLVYLLLHLTIYLDLQLLLEQSRLVVLADRIRPTDLALLKVVQVL